MKKQNHKTGSEVINNETKKDLKSIPRIFRPINAARISCSQPRTKCKKLALI